MSHLINAVPIGRLGNQMFQIAALIGYAKKYNAQWGFPSDTKEVPHLRKMFPGIPVLDGNFRRYNVADPSHFNYRPIPQFGGDTTLVGFFQSEKFFEGAADQVRSIFKLDTKNAGSPSLSIHVRRGDYVQHSNSFPPVTIDYIKLAFDLLKHKGVDFYYVNVFSDDIQWCRQLVNHVQGPRGMSNWAFFEGQNEFEDLSIMASCSHNIIANSTFSWWGAWLNPNPDKIVISPSVQNWFGPANGVQNPKDIIPESWIQIKY